MEFAFNSISLKSNCVSHVNEGAELPPPAAPEAPPPTPTPVADSAPAPASAARPSTLDKGPAGVDYSACGEVLAGVMRRVTPVEMQIFQVDRAIVQSMSDSARVDFLIQTYAVVRDDQGQPVQVTLPPYDGEGNRLMFRCPVSNQRKQRATMLKYSKGIGKAGIVRGVRGQAFVTLSSTNSWPFKAMTFGTLSDAFYHRHLKDLM